MKPNSIRIINALLIFRYLLIVLVIGITGYVIYNSPEPGILTGIANISINTVGIKTPIEVSS